MKVAKVGHLNLLYLVLAIIIAFYCYYGVLDNYFYMDENMWIADAKTTTLNFWDTFDTSKNEVRVYSFLPHLIYFLLLQIGKWNPMPFYMTSIILRIITSFFLFNLIYRYTKKAIVAACASLIFLVNFSSYETVLMNCNIAYTAGLFFYVLALYIFLLDTENKSNLKLFSFFGLYIANLLSHENAFTLPLICFVAFFLFNYESKINFSSQFFRIARDFLKRYFLLFLFITLPYLVVRPIPLTLSPCRNYLVYIGTVAKSTLTWFVPEGVLYRLIFLLNKIFHMNSTYNIQENIFLTIVALLVFIIFTGISIIAFFNFFIKREKRCMLLVAMGLLIMVLNIFPYAIGKGEEFFGQCVGIFPPGRILYYPSIGFSFVIAGIVMVFYNLRTRKSVILKYIFLMAFIVYMLLAFTVNKKLEQSYHHDTNIFRIIHTSLKKNMAIFPFGSTVYVDLTSFKAEVGHSHVGLFRSLVSQLLDDEPPYNKSRYTEPLFCQVPFALEFFCPPGQNIKHQLIQELSKKGCSKPVFYFELVNDKLAMYQWSPLKKAFLIKNEQSQVVN